MFCLDCGGQSSTVMEELTLIKEDLALAREQRDELEALMTALCVIIPKANKQ